MGIEIGVSAFREAEAYFNNRRTGIMEYSNNNHSFKVYPNPVVDEKIIIELNYPGSRSDLRIQWVDMFGKVVKNDRAVLNEDLQNIQLSTAGLTPGIYVLYVSGTNWKASQKVVVNN